MGINLLALQLLLYADRRGADFSAALTLGRQRRNFDAERLCRTARRFSKRLDREWLERICSDEFSESLFRWLGAKHVDSIDVSDYQGASVIHDLNDPLPERAHAKYSLVVDSGTLEHVFNVPEAIRSCIALLRRGGHYLAVTPSNNFMGHGFYQLSPELLFRTFEKNGFTDIEAFLAARGSVNGWYRCPNPREARSRVMLSSLEPTFLMFIARKDRDVSPFVNPQQSDYEDIAWVQRKAWSGDERSFSARMAQQTLKRLPEPAAKLARRGLDVLGSFRGLWARQAFESFDPATD